MAIETVGDLMRKLAQFDQEQRVRFFYLNEAPYLYPVSFYETPDGWRCCSDWRGGNGAWMKSVTARHSHGSCNRGEALVLAHLRDVVRV